jgi:DNA polymerase-3 subunit delta
MSKPTPTFYLFHGDDDLSIDEAVNKLRAAMGSDANADLNISEFEGQNTSVPEVVNAVSSYPFLADKRLVIVKGLLTWISRKGAGETGKKAVEQLLESLPTLPPYARLVFVEREKLADNNKLVKLAQSDPNGYEKCFAAPKDSTSWIIKRARDAYTAEIEPRAASALASVTAEDLRRADNELLKLVSYVGGERPISENDVALLTPYVAEASLFEMVDALAEGRGQVVVSLIHRLLGDQKEDPFALYGMIVRQFRLLLLAREYLSGGGNPAHLAEAIHVHSFVAQKLAKQSRSFSVQQLERIYRALLDYDVKMKTGRIKPELALDLFIAALAQ